MRVALFTREYPPDVYGGAGVHVEYLARELARRVDLTVHCWGDDRPDTPSGPRVVAHRPWDALTDGVPAHQALATLSVDLRMAQAADAPEIAHSHTWYANVAGHLTKLIHDVPHVATVHSLEPLRPWKAEQLQGGYAVSTWCEASGLREADAVIAVSAAHREDIVRSIPGIDPARVTVIRNGVDTDEYRPDPGHDVLERHGVDPTRPSVLFVGRITHQKGLTHLLDAVPGIAEDAQIVLCAGAPDTPAIADEIAGKVNALRATRDGVVWISEMLPKPDLIQLLTHATVFVCPSIYEPLGIVNLEAMACGTAVVASAVGGIPEVVADGETGRLVPVRLANDASGSPVDPGAFAGDLADAINEILADPDRATRMGDAGRRRVEDQFSWRAVAEQTLSLYLTLRGSASPPSV